MYKINYLPLALQDMSEIIFYIGIHLANPAAADKLAEEMIEASKGLADMPYRFPVYASNRLHKHEYRKLIVQTILCFIL